MSLARTGWMGRWRLAGIALVGCLALGLVGAASALAEEAKFGSTGAEQEFKVPAGVTSVNVVAVGARGLNFKSTSAGLGARVQGSIAVTPGHTLYVEVGGEGKLSSAAFNGGGRGAGGGGGASDVREVSIGAEPSPGGETSLKSRLIVAGGGGGEGASTGCRSGSGGSAEQGGENGENCGAAAGGEGGGAGSQTEGGKGGGRGGQPGGLGTGGEGAVGVVGGGGGGGLYGGGGGGESLGAHAFDGGGGGGGSNLVPSGGEAKLAEEEATSVTITYTVPVPTSIQQCQKNGWKNYGTMFKNQGQCVKFVETGH